MAHVGRGYIYELGTLLWVKIGCHPYWPAMVSYDPNNGNFFKIVTGKKGNTEIYHVQYFGKTSTRGWTCGAMFLFQGHGKYLALRDEAIKNASCATVRQRIKKKFHVPPSVMNNWLIAVNEGEKAMRYRIEDRYELYVFKYIHFQKNGKEQKKKRRKRKKGKKTVQPILTQPSSIVEPLCYFCERGNVNLCCKGICGRAYHKECLGIIQAPNNFLCSYCAVDQKQPCIICKSVGVNTEKCSRCNTYYHDYCLVRFKCADVGKKVCSAHVCWSCYSRNPRSASCSKGPFVTCFRCPTAFHDTVNCLPVGTVKLSPDKIVCPQHFLGKNKVSPQPIANVSFCSSCFIGGKIICCEFCPNAFHSTCINGEVPIGDYICDNCTSRKYLFIGAIVWAKSGVFRWWPAQILDPDNLPTKIKNLPRFDGEFPVLFFGSDEYYWTHRGKVFPYNETNKNMRVSFTKSNRETWVNFVISLEEAAEAYEEYLQKFVNNVNKNKPAPFRHIRVNRAIPPAIINNKPQSSCTCSYTDENPCGPDSMCLNRTMLCECYDGNCKAKEKCQNQLFQKRQYPTVKIIKTPDRGFGLQAQQFIPKGTFVIEYVGEIITTKEYERRYHQMRLSNCQNYYFLYVDNRRLIDAGPSGNLSRFINHSCNPNCIMEKWCVNNDLRIGIFAVTDIPSGEELTFNYQSEVEFGQQCNCGSRNCLGIIGKNGNNKRKKH